MQCISRGLDMLKNDRIDIDDLYPLYKNLVVNVSRGFLRKLPDEELDDLSQTCWERIVTRYPEYEPGTSELNVWIILISKAALYDMLNKAHADKRSVLKHSTSLDRLAEGKGRYL